MSNKGLIRFKEEEEQADKEEEKEDVIHERDGFIGNL